MHQNSVYAYAEAAKTLQASNGVGEEIPSNNATELAKNGVRLVIEGAKVELLQGAVKNAVQNIQGRARAVQGQ